MLLKKKTLVRISKGIIFINNQVSMASTVRHLTAEAGDQDSSE